MFIYTIYNKIDNSLLSKYYSLEWYNNNGQPIFVVQFEDAWRFRKHCSINYRITTMVSSIIYMMCDGNYFVRPLTVASLEEDVCRKLYQENLYPIPADMKDCSRVYEIIYSTLPKYIGVKCTDLYDNSFKLLEITEFLSPKLKEYII